MTSSDLATFDNRWSIRHVRVYPHPIDLVWEAVTTGEHLDAWMLPRCTIDLKVGGVCTFTWGDASPEAEGIQSVITELDPPHVVDYGGLRFELEEVDGGTRLTFIQSFPEGTVFEDGGSPESAVPVPGTPWQPGFCTGFHLMLDRLPDYLDKRWTYEDTLAEIDARLAGTPDPVYDSLVERYHAHIEATLPDS